MMLAETGVDLIFRSARSHDGRRNRPADKGTLRRPYHLLERGPTGSDPSMGRMQPDVLRNLGCGDPARLLARDWRPAFEDACRIA